MNKHENFNKAFWSSKDAKAARAVVDAWVTDDFLMLFNESKFTSKEIAAATWIPATAYVTKVRTNQILRQWN